MEEYDAYYALRAALIELAKENKMENSKLEELEKKYKELGEEIERLKSEPKFELETNGYYYNNDVYSNEGFILQEVTLSTLSFPTKEDAIS